MPTDEDRASERRGKVRDKNRDKEDKKQQNTKPQKTTPKKEELPPQKQKTIFSSNHTRKKCQYEDDSVQI